VRGRRKIFLCFNFMLKHGRIRIIDQRPRTAARHKVRQQGQLRLRRLRFGRTGIEVVRHGDDGKQNADHAQQREQRGRRSARIGARQPGA